MNNYIANTATLEENIAAARAYMKSKAGDNIREIYAKLNLDEDFVERAIIQKAVHRLTSEQISAIQARLHEPQEVDMSIRKTAAVEAQSAELPVPTESAPVMEVVPTKPASAQSAFMAESWERIAARERGDFIEEEEARMNELANEKTMTVKEVADVLGVTPEAIKKHVREMYPEILRDGVMTYLNEEQVTAIKQKMIPTTQVVGSFTSLDIERMTLQVIEYHVSRVRELEEEVADMKPKAEYHDALEPIKEILSRNKDGNRIALPTIYEVWGDCEEAKEGNWESEPRRLEYFKKIKNRIKAKDSDTGWWWLSTADASSSTNFCSVTASGAAGNSYFASDSNGVSPCFCIS
jgi:predicted transcriptional regulator